MSGVCNFCFVSLAYINVTVCSQFVEKLSIFTTQEFLLLLIQVTSTPEGREIDCLCNSILQVEQQYSKVRDCIIR
jgi:hypothetical protein